MTGIFTQQFTAEPVTLVAQDQSLLIDADGRHVAHISGLPPHVAEHTAAAFNRAMRVVPAASGWTYTTKSGVWHIHSFAPGIYRAQHDDITGDNDPAWMFADARTLIGCMDEIDAIEDENACDECHRLLGDDDLSECTDDSLCCDDCLFGEAEHQRGMAEMAQDDMAHAAREKAMGL